MALKNWNQNQHENKEGEEGLWEGGCSVLVFVHGLRCVGRSTSTFVWTRTLARDATELQY
jgi:hypothetical protein